MNLSLEHFVQLFRERASNRKANHFGTLALKFISAEKGKAALDLPYSEQLVANPSTGAIAVGAIVALLDTTCAVAAATAQETIRFCPTLDLRVDHLRQPEAGKTIRAEAEVYRLTRGVIFTHGLAFHDHRDQPIARCQINFTPVEPAVVEFDQTDEGVENS